MDGHETRNASRQYCIPHDLGLILNALLRMTDYELQSGAKSHHPSRQNLNETLGENQDIPPRRTQTHEGEQKPGSEQKDRVGLPSQTNGAFLPRHMRAPGR